MTAEERRLTGADAGTDSTAPATTTTTTVPGAVEAPKKYPKGVILGKDGKPCRSCNSFAAFTSQTRALSSVPAAPPKDCPPDGPQLGRSTWTLLHSIAASYPKTPTSTQQSEIVQFMGLFAKLYPCWVCAEDFQEYMKKEKIRAGSRDEFGTWLCEAHNEVNKKLGKKEFDCSRWQERWRTGWKDGRCD